ncbi:hypothetical protein BDV98DRAFT_278065 [Pterulicium gracile]|uniref:Uncharacterized protein n=1 Tax=Pterulicium gracile TaxID=1884261 RepID=A0A5C3QSF4_9AGAR|nr:hypothetical protein BDV98DRAFT_278065 [Pterula gracilis]
MILSTTFIDTQPNASFSIRSIKSSNADLLDPCIDVLANAMTHVENAIQSQGHVLRNDESFSAFVVVWAFSFFCKEELASLMKRWTRCSCTLKQSARLTSFHTHKSRRISDKEAEDRMCQFTDSIFNVLMGLAFDLPDSPFRARRMLLPEGPDHTSPEAGLMGWHRKDVYLHALTRFLAFCPLTLARSCIS